MFLCEADLEDGNAAPDYYIDGVFNRPPSVSVTLIRLLYEVK